MLGNDPILRACSYRKPNGCLDAHSPYSLACPGYIINRSINHKGLQLKTVVDVTAHTQGAQDSADLFCDKSSHDRGGIQNLVNPHSLNQRPSLHDLVQDQGFSPQR